MARAKLQLMKDVNGNVTFGIYGTLSDDQNANTILSSGVAQNISVPAWANSALFVYNTGGTVYVNRTNTATVPGGSFAYDTNELNPILRGVIPGGTVSCITENSNAAIEITFFETPGN